MKTAILALAAALTLSGPALAAKTGNSAQAKGEAQLAKMLDGRVAGEPQTCISAQISNRLSVIDQTALVYDAGGTIYVAKPQDPSSLRSNDVLIIKRFSSQLCKQDVIQTVDRMSGFMTGVVFLGDFVPYKKG